jgi:hypothetical protein
MRCIGKKGETRTLPIGDLLTNAVPEILERAEARGVKVTVQDSP